MAACLLRMAHAEGSAVRAQVHASNQGIKYEDSKRGLAQHVITFMAISFSQRLQHTNMAIFQKRGMNTSAQLTGYCCEVPEVGCPCWEAWCHFSHTIMVDPNGCMPGRFVSNVRLAFHPLGQDANLSICDVGPNVCRDHVEFN